MEATRDRQNSSLSLPSTRLARLWALVALTRPGRLDTAGTMEPATRHPPALIHQSINQSASRQPDYLYDDAVAPAQRRLPRLRESEREGEAWMTSQGSAVAKGG